MTHRITASLIAGSALTILTAAGALAHAVPEIGQARTALGQTAPVPAGIGRTAATPLPQPLPPLACRWPPARWTS
jgi:hypothetical protein